MNVFIKTYDWFCQQKRFLWLLLCLLILMMSLLANRIRFHEDIFDFLPQDDEYIESMRVYSSLSEASRIVVIFEGTDPDSIVSAIDAFGEAREDAITELDIEGFLSRLEFIGTHMAYFLSEDDYILLEKRLQNMDSCLFVDKQILSMPGTSFLGRSIATDPLRMISLSMGANGQYAGAQSSFDAYNGYMMTADHRMGFAFCDSPYGSTESSKNGLLVDSLREVCSSVMDLYPTINIRLLGSPVIAVGNARQIKKDSIFAIFVSLILIAGLLLYAFPRRRDMLLIAISIGFGWLCGMAALAIIGIPVSVIVLGIGVILIGIAVNYPLHLLVHQRYTTSVRQTLQEVLSPLVVGNITTIGAFFALLPLSSPALRQLGIFASAMLAGTILFCILFLPHMMSSEATLVREIPMPKILLRYRKSTMFGIGLTAILLFVVLLSPIGKEASNIKSQGFFDSNLTHINFMTDQQRSDFAYFESLSPVSGERAYLASSARVELAHRLELWNHFWSTHNPDSVSVLLRESAAANGFHPAVFEPFIQTISNPIDEVDLSNPEALASVWPGRFDSSSLNSHVASSLSDSFDYLGMVCSLIVLVFLCLSFRSIVLGLLAFVPMLLSWLLIFAFMYLFDLQFNIVNVILATFIFGQGDDYTIFVVEGLLHEYKTGKKILAQFKQSIILSALIMLLAIGVLVFAKHPAMHSLGAVTLIGMSCVVFMAYVIPPLFFRILLRISYFRNQLKN